MNRVYIIDGIKNFYGSFQSFAAAKKFIDTTQAVIVNVTNWVCNNKDVYCISVTF